MNSRPYSVLVLAAGRGANDPMAKAFNVTHKCLLDVAGTPMIMRVLAAVSGSIAASNIAISIEDPEILQSAEGFTEYAARENITVVKSSDRASSSVAHALESGAVGYPLLVTTADHALLTPQMVDDFCLKSVETKADLTVGLARDETILAAYPDSVRTFLKFSDGKFSGCNLFTFNTAQARKAIEFWQHIERNRKTPWKLVGAFGLSPLIRYVTGFLSLGAAFAGGSQKLGLKAAPVELFDAHAAIDVDKPSDLELVERILADERDKD